MRRNDVASTLIRRHFSTKCPLGRLFNFNISKTKAKKEECSLVNSEFNPATNGFSEASGKANKQCQNNIQYALAFASVEVIVYLFLTVLGGLFSVSCGCPGYQNPVAFSATLTRDITTLGTRQQIAFDKVCLKSCLSFFCS